MIAQRFNYRASILLVLSVVAINLWFVRSAAANGSVGVETGKLDFGTVVVGNKVTLPDAISNNTSHRVTIEAIEGAGADFEVTGISLPMVLGPGSTAPFSVQFHPTSIGNPVATIAFAGQDSTLISLQASGEVVERGKLSANPSPIAFGNVNVGTNATLSVTLQNYGGTNLTIKQATLSGAGFSMGNMTLPIVLQPGQTTQVTFTFAPPQIGTFAGTISFATTAGIHIHHINNYVFNLSGSGVSPVVVAPSPSPLAFGTVAVGKTSNQTETLTNTGSSAVTLTAATMTGSGFTISGLSLPLMLSGGQSTSFTVAFTPAGSGTASGTINVSAVGMTSTVGNLSVSVPVSGSGVASGSLSSSPSSPNFGNVTVGSNQSMPVTISNTGGSTVTVSSAAASGTGFMVSGPGMPVTLNAGGSTTFTVSFNPTQTGAASGALTITSDASNSALSVPLAGTGVGQGLLGSSPTSLSFGNIQVGTSKAMSATLTNSGGTSLTISAASASGAGFTLSGLSLPVTLNAGQSASFSVTYAPTASGASSGSVSITSNGSDASLSVPLAGTGVTQGTVAANPTSLSFGTIQVGSNTSLPATLTNTGGSSLTISAAAASGSGFILSGLTLPLTLNAGQSASFTVAFAPTSSGAASGNLTIASNGSDPSLSIALSGTGQSPAGTLASNPTSLLFGSVQVSNSTNLSETLTNTGGSPLTISQASVTGAGFSISGLTLPVTLNANQSVTFTATFAPTSAASASGTLSVTSNASDSTLSVALSGTGTAPGQLAVNPTSLSFGNVTVGSSSTLTSSVTASGAAVQITSAGLSNGEFAISGMSLPMTLNAGQSATFSVSFTPQTSGSASASLTFASNAQTASTVETMTGSGTTPVQHSVGLTWTGSNSAVGYNVYRGTVSGGPYTMINSSQDGTTSYTDTSVASGQTYYYVATAVDSNDNESAYSTQTKAVVPTP